MYSIVTRKNNTSIIFLLFRFLVKIVCVLMGVAFITLLERKFLGFSQNRFGPNKVRLWGILQPVLDGVKLLLKTIDIPLKALKNFYFILPAARFFLILTLWVLLPEKFVLLHTQFPLIALIIFLGCGVFLTLLTGWRRWSKFARVGGVRASSQRISYEISLAVVLFVFFVSASSTSLSIFISFNFFFAVLYFLPVLFIWLIICLAETNRAPFDFAEGERELISGFNIEFSSLLFVFLFLAEYGIIIFFSILTQIVFFSKNLFLGVLVIFLLLIIRRTYPRFRYDKLLIWMLILPNTIYFLWVGFL